MDCGDGADSSPACSKTARLAAGHFPHKKVPLVSIVALSRPEADSYDNDGSVQPSGGRVDNSLNACAMWNYNLKNRCDCPAVSDASLGHHAIALVAE